MRGRNDGGDEANRIDTEPRIFQHHRFLKQGLSLLKKRGDDLAYRHVDTIDEWDAGGQPVAEFIDSATEDVARQHADQEHQCYDDQ